MPTPPVEVADEVELYARQTGRHATVEYVPTLLKGTRPVAGTWRVRFTLKPDDKRLSLYQTGKMDEPPTEDVWLHVPDQASPLGYRPLDLVQLGASGVREFLERGNLWSGRGEYKSLEQMVREVRESNTRNREKHKQQQKVTNREEQREKRRWRFKIPFLPVGIDLQSKSNGRGKSVRPDVLPSAPRQET